MQSTEKSIDNPFWRFSLSCYERSGVAALCLEAQDRCAVDVNEILYAAWLARQSMALDSAHLRGLRDVAGPWHRRVVVPLRSVRRALDKRHNPALRRRLLALELRCERWQQALMWRYYRGVGPPAQKRGCLGRNLELVFPAGCGGQGEAMVRRLAAVIAPP